MLNGQFLLFLAAGSLKPFIPKHFIRITIFLTLSTQNKMFGKENKENDHTVFIYLFCYSFIYSFID